MLDNRAGKSSNKLRCDAAPSWDAGHRSSGAPRQEIPDRHSSATSVFDQQNIARLYFSLHGLTT